MPAMSRVAASSCVHNSTAILTVATSSTYLDAALLLAQSARQHSAFACVLIAAPASLLPLTMQHARLLSPIALPQWASEWRAERHFCTTRLSGWRQTHVLKTQALLSLLSRGLDVLLVDVDRRFVGDPLPALVSLRVDVAGLRDEALLNFGLVYVRASAPTLAMARRVANRSVAAWDQAVFSEELAAAAALSCCYTNVWIRQCVRLEQRTHDLNKDAHAIEQTQVSQATRGCRQASTRSNTSASSATASVQEAAAASPHGPALRPPAGIGRMYLTWHPTRFNELPVAHRRYSRCTRTPCRVRAGGMQQPVGGEGGGSAIPLVCMSENATIERPLVAHKASRAAPRMPDEHVAPSLRCTMWPAGSDGLPDRERCAHGDSLHDGYRYYHNRGRGTRHAFCGQQAACTCCRRPENESQPGAR